MSEGNYIYILKIANDLQMQKNPVFETLCLIRFVFVSFVRRSFLSYTVRIPASHTPRMYAPSDTRQCVKLCKIDRFSEFFGFIFGIIDFKITVK